MERNDTNIHRMELIITLDYLLNYTNKENPLKAHDKIVDYAFVNYDYKAKRQRIGETLDFLYDLTKKYNMPFTIQRTKSGRYFVDKKYDMDNQKLLDLLIDIKGGKHIINKDEYISVILNSFSNEYDKKIILSNLGDIKVNETISYDKRKYDLVKKALLEEKSLLLRRDGFDSNNKPITINMPGMTCNYRIYKIVEDNNKPYAILLPLTTSKQRIVSPYKDDFELYAKMIYRPIDELEISNGSEREILIEDEKRDFNELFRIAYPEVYRKYGSIDNFYEKVIQKKKKINVCFYVNKYLFKDVSRSFNYFFNKTLDYKICKKKDIEEKFKVKMKEKSHYDDVALVDIAVNYHDFIKWGLSNPNYDNSTNNVFDLIYVISPRRINREVRSYYLQRIEKYSDKEFMNSTINIIGIGEKGKSELDKITFDNYKNMLSKVNVLADKPIFNNEGIQKYGERFTVKKHYVNSPDDLIIDDINYSSIVIYDESDYKIANKVSIKLPSAETINIGICIGEKCNKIEGLRVINTQSKFVKEGLIGLLDLIIPDKQVLDDLDYQRMINYFKENFTYKLISFASNDFNELLCMVKEELIKEDIDKMITINICNNCQLIDLGNYIKEIDKFSKNEGLCSVDYVPNKETLNSTIIYRTHGSNNLAGKPDDCREKNNNIEIVKEPKMDDIFKF